MSIVELLKSVDTLAKIINQKNLELEELKKGYDSKLHEINKYIRILQEQEAIETEKDIKDIPEEIFREKIGSTIRCSNCDHEVWSINSDSDFIIIPKRKLQYLLGHERDGSLLNELKDLTIQNDLATHKSPEIRSSPHHYSGFNGYKKQYNTKSKKTCSYCSKPGHSRAHCLIRLSTPTK
mmetsp:Transcript_81/g.84  ORF Transcript_81/g.84 Transcript_81/m.84 type:complete len:180 (+) Transcript_81:30-569(+)